jgi:signal transduction histidine kinase
MSGASSLSTVELGILATGLAHEIRNRLNTIRFNLFGIQNDPAGPERAKGVKGETAALVQGIDDEVDRLEGILREFLHLARPEPPQIEPVNLGELLESVVRLMSEPSRSPDIELSWDCSPEVSAAADPNQLKHVLPNLVLNSQQAMPQGGRIHLRGYLSRDHAVMEVANTGLGIPLHVRARILQPFFSTKQGGLGLGLGLSICQRLIEQMNGRLEFQTEVGRGTTFVISLPLPPSLSAPGPEGTREGHRESG